MHAALPPRALLNQGVATADSRAQVEQVSGRIHDSGKPADQQQLAQVTGVSPIGLRASLLAFQGAGLCRLGEANVSADLLELLDHKAPAGVASNATSRSAPPNRARNCRTPARSAGAILAREIYPVFVSSHSVEICARC